MIGTVSVANSVLITAEMGPVLQAECWINRSSDGNYSCQLLRWRLLGDVAGIFICKLHVSEQDITLGEVVMNAQLHKSVFLLLSAAKYI